MIDKRMEKEINKQINEELFSAYLYQAMSAYFDDSNLPGFSAWMDNQAREEMVHARKFYDYLQDRGGRVVLEAIEKPKTDWESPLEAMEESFEHEKHITGRINEMLDVAEELKDRPTMSMLQWFVDEQVEEEASVDEYVQLLKMIGDENRGLIMVDREMSQRGAPSGAEEAE